MELAEQIRKDPNSRRKISKNNKEGLSFEDQKYYGKWPFRRVLGMQELLSVIFSIGNLAVNLVYIPILSRRLFILWQTLQLKGDQAYSRLFQRACLWVAFALVNANSWVWSTVFHSRDTWRTQVLDYLGADANVAMALATSIIRTLMDGRPWKQKLGLAALVFLGYLRHMYYMIYVKFDFGYNMALCVACGITTAVVWLCWAYRTAHPARLNVVSFIILVHLVMLFELLDFPPLWRLVDAHAMWHATTIPLAVIWYLFVLDDLEFVADIKPDGRALASASRTQ